MEGAIHVRSPKTKFLKMDKKLLGLQTAKGGFANEYNVVAKFNDWENDGDAQSWLQIMGYELNKVDSVSAIQIPTKIKKSDVAKYGVTELEYEKFVKFKKADVQIKLLIQVGEILKIENLSLKKANANADFNQIDKRSVSNYQEMWNFDAEIALWLKLFSGELLAKNYSYLFQNQILREEKRIFIDEMPPTIQDKILSFFDKNRMLVVADILKGRGGLSANWILVTRHKEEQGLQKLDWVLKDMNIAMNFYAQGEVKITKNGSLKIAKFSMQRKGGTPDPTKLQFKFSPCDLFELI